MLFPLEAGRNRSLGQEVISVLLELTAHVTTEREGEGRGEERTGKKLQRGRGKEKGSGGTRRGEILGSIRFKEGSENMRRERGRLRRKGREKRKGDSKGKGRRKRGIRRRNLGSIRFKEGVKNMSFQKGGNGRGCGVKILTQV